MHPGHPRRHYSRLKTCRETCSATSSYTAVKNCLNNFLRSHFSEDFSESLIAVPAYVFVYIFGIYNTAVSECDTFLFLIERSFVKRLYIVALDCFAVKKFLYRLTADNMLIDDSRYFVCINT